MLFLRILGGICAFVGVFLFGMWLAWPEWPYNPSGFPLDRKFRLAHVCMLFVRDGLRISFGRFGFPGFFKQLPGTSLSFFR